MVNSALRELKRRLLASLLYGEPVTVLTSNSAYPKWLVADLFPRKPISALTSYPGYLMILFSSQFSQF